MFSWTESLEFVSGCELARGAPAMTSDDSARCLGDATTEYDYNYENQWIEKRDTSIIIMQLRGYADNQMHGKCE